MADDDSVAVVISRSRLSELGEAWLRGPTDRAMAAAPLLIPGFDKDGIAWCVYDLPVGDYAPDCHPGIPCPTDHTGEHATSAMVPLGVIEFVGDAASNPVVDGLAPSIIRHIKAHMVVWWDESCWATHARRKSRRGDTRSYGAILIKVPLKRGAYFGFIVAVSGMDPFDDQQLAYLIANAIVAQLQREKRIESVMPDSPTFVIGADPAVVAAYAEEMA